MLHFDNPTTIILALYVLYTLFPVICVSTKEKKKTIVSSAGTHFHSVTFTQKIEKTTLKIVM